MYQNLIFWLALCLEILDNVCIVIIYFPVYVFTNVEVNLSFRIKPFSYMNKKSGQNFKSFYHEIKSVFHHFKEFLLKEIKTSFLEGESPTLSTMKFDFPVIGLNEHKIRSYSLINNICLPGYTFCYSEMKSSHGGTGFCIKINFPM